MNLLHTINRIKRRIIVTRRDGWKYLFKTNRQLRNRQVHIRTKATYGAGYLSNKKSIKQKLIKRDGKLCQWCVVKFPIAELTIDHITPKREGGTNALYNLRLLCTECHELRNKLDTT